MTVEEQIENAVARGWTRVGLVPIYAEGIRRHYAKDVVVDWKRVNAAILTRFKRSGLLWISDKAWRKPAKPEAVA